MTLDPGITAAQPGHIGEKLGPDFFHRVAWTVVDQGLSSLSNFALAVAVARFVTTENFGAYGIAVAAYLLALGVARSLTSEPFVVRYTGVHGDAFAERGGSASGTSLAIGLLASVVLVAVAAIMHAPIARPLLATAVVLPFLLVQDLWRYLLIARGDPKWAAVNDTIWVVLQLVGTGILVANGRYSHSVSAWILMWGSCGAVAAIAGAFQCRIVPRIDHLPAWWRTESPFMWRFLVESIVAFGWVPITLLALAGISGLGAVASLRGAQAVFGPLFVVGAGVMGALLPEGVRVLDVAPRRLTHMLIVASGSLGLASAVFSVALFATPEATGRAVLGASWAGTHKIVLIYGLAMAASSLALGAATGMRALRAISTSLRRRLATAPALFIAPLLGAAIRGAPGFALGFLLAATLQAVILWGGFHAAMRAHRSNVSGYSITRQPEASRLPGQNSRGSAPAP